MRMGPRLRKLALFVHIVSAVGWLGAVAAVLGMAIIGVSSNDAEAVRAVYVAMEPAAVFVLVPLSLASLITGVVQALGGPWGLLQHYWVVLKLVINVVASVVLVQYLQTLDALADTASAAAAGDPALLRSASPVLHGAAALVLLLIAAGLSVFKPRGRTRHGWRTQQKVLRARELATPDG